LLALLNSRNAMTATEAREIGDENELKR